MKLAAIDRVGLALVRIIEKLQSNLIGDEQSQEVWIATVGQYPEQRGPVDMSALACKCVERVFADGRIGNRQGAAAPYLNLTRDCP